MHTVTLEFEEGREMCISERYISVDIRDRRAFPIRVNYPS